MCRRACPEATISSRPGGRLTSRKAKGARVRYCLRILMLAAVTAAVVGCKQKNPDLRKLQTDDEPPLLLEDGNDEEPAVDGPVADNSRCHVCHINYADEELALIHARANIGCEQCHGACDAHCNDEDNITPPDIMYSLENINSSCMVCHPKDKIDIQPHESLFDPATAEKEYCTDCHGSHRLGYRTRKWDKKTGELLEDDKVRMTTDEMFEQE
jgi:hypothetical protein